MNKGDKEETTPPRAQRSQEEEGAQPRALEARAT